MTLSVLQYSRQCSDTMFLQKQSTSCQYAKENMVGTRMQTPSLCNICRHNCCATGNRASQYPSAQAASRSHSHGICTMMVTAHTLPGQSVGETSHDVGWIMLRSATSMHYNRTPGEHNSFSHLEQFKAGIAPWLANKTNLNK